MSLSTFRSLRARVKEHVVHRPVSSHTRSNGMNTTMSTPPDMQRLTWDDEVAIYVLSLLKRPTSYDTLNSERDEMEYVDVHSNNV